MQRRRETTTWFTKAPQKASDATTEPDGLGKDVGHPMTVALFTTMAGAILDIAAKSEYS